MGTSAKAVTGIVLIGAAGCGIKWWLDNQKPQDASPDTAWQPRPVAPSTPSHREVTATGKDANGTVTSLHGDWGNASKDEAIADIEAGRATYAVAGGQPLDVVAGATGKYLRSVADGGTADNLDELPDPDPVEPA